jgi:hypothetical protein
MPAIAWTAALGKVPYNELRGWRIDRLDLRAVVTRRVPTARSRCDEIPLAFCAAEWIGDESVPTRRASVRVASLAPDMALEHSASHNRAVDVAVGVHAYALGARVVGAR